MGCSRWGRRKASHKECRPRIYSLGCAAYHLVTGHVPFIGMSTLDLMTKRVCECSLPKPPTEFGAPKDMSDLIMACLHVDPAHRPQSMDQLAVGLEGCLNGKTWTQEDSRRWWSENDPLGEKRDKTKA